MVVLALLVIHRLLNETVLSSNMNKMGHLPGVI